jgi:predicted lipoprotein with Yx(FWY)xxD motif
MRPLAKTLCLSLLMSCFGSTSSHAGWIENGAPLTRQWGAVRPGVMVSDGSSGAIMAYPSCQEGVGRILAQRVNSLGAVLWGEEGITVCTATGGQWQPQITTDGAGGAIVTWHDHRDGNYDIYAQRVNASGAVQWAASGVPLCTATGDQENPQVTSDGAGGVIITWEDNRSGHWDIYAQRVSASGTVQWAPDGVPLCATAGDQEFPQITFDGAGGAIVTWHDTRSVGPGVYAQRVNASGAVQWTLNGVPLCTAAGGQWQPQITTDGGGGAVVAWQDYRSVNTNIYAQRVSASGAVQWTLDGVSLCSDSGDKFSPRIISDGAGGVVATWDDFRTGDLNVYTQRVNASGSVLWDPEGVPLCTAAGDQWYSAVVSSGAGGAIVTWMDSRGGNEYDMYAQRVNASGATQWTEDGIALCTATGDQQSPAAASDGAGGAIAAWYDYRSVSAGIYAQRLNASGADQWEANGVAVGSAAGDQEDAEIASDGAGGAIVTWKDFRNGNYDIYAQRINASGVVQWMAGGVALCAAVGNQENPQIISDGNGGAIVTWLDFRGGSDADIYAQRIDASGASQWAADGVALCTATGEQSWPAIVSDGAGGAIVAWEDNRGGNFEYNIYAQRVNASGAVQWTADGVPLCAAAGDQSGSSIATDGAGGAIVTWYDYRSWSNYRIYGQRVNASGAVLWTVDGVRLCAASGNQESPKIISDNAGGAMVTWMDSRSGSGYDIYAQRVNGSGAVLWTGDGVALCMAVDYQYDPHITSDGAGGAVVAWVDYRTGFYSDIYAQKVNASGIVQWEGGGVLLCTATDYQSNSQIASDGAGGAIVVWQDDRNGSPDIYAQRVNGSGAIQWVADGASICAATGDQLHPQIASDGAGGAIIAWEDQRCGKLTYAQRILASGDIEATLLQHYSAVLEGASLSIAWVLSEIDEGARFSIFRASAPEWKYVECEGVAIVKNGLSFTFTDARCLPGTTYKHRVYCEVEGTPRRMLFETDAITMPALPVTLYQNRPNPFNPRTVIRFFLPEAQEIFLDVYDVAGERVARLAEGRKGKGYHEVIWDGRNSSGKTCSSGVYFTRLHAGKHTVSRKVVIMR